MGEVPLGNLTKKLKDFTLKSIYTRDAKKSFVVMHMYSYASKVLGYVRYLLLAYFFGTSELVDIFWIVYSMWNYIIGIINSMLRVGAIPVLAEVRAQKGEKYASYTMARILRYILIGSIMISITAAFTFPWVGRIILKGFGEKELSLIPMMTILLLGYGFAELILTALDTWSLHRGYYAMITVIRSSNNFVGVPIIAISFCVFNSFWGLPLSWSIGSILTLILTVKFLSPLPLIEKERVHVLRKMIKNAGASIGSIGVSLIFMLTDNYFASTLGTGNISALSYSEIIMGLLKHTKGISRKLLLGKLTEDIANKDFNKVNYKFITYYSLILLYFFPLTIILWILSPIIFKLLFTHGAFSAFSLEITTKAFRGGIIGFPFAMLSVFLGTSLIALQKPYIAMFIGYISAVINYVLDYILAPLYGVFGIALATSGVNIFRFAFLLTVVTTLLQLPLKKLLPPTLIASSLSALLILIYVISIKFSENPYLQAMIPTITYFAAIALLERKVFPRFLDSKWLLGQNLLTAWNKIRREFSF